MTRWVVVGGGSAGCVVAARLSERAADDVVLIEAGPDHGVGAVSDDVGPHLGDAERVRSDPATRPGHDPMPYLRGHGLGGTSLVNGGIVTDLASPTVDRLPLQDPWVVGPVGSALLGSDPAARPVQLVRRGDRRVTAADAFLRPAMERPNLSVVTEAVVDRLVVAGRRVTGVVTADGDTVVADRVVMCAGAIHTPALLLRSGIDTPGIGEGLEDHPAFTIALGLDPESVSPGVPTIAVAADHETYQVLTVEHVADASDLAALVVALVTTSARGRVRLPDRDGPPVVDLPRVAPGQDLEPLTVAVEAVIGLLDRPAWKRITTAAYADDRGTPLASIAGSRDDIRSWVGAHIGGYFHAAATCRDGVVSDGGVVRGYSCLYVADASALPALPRHDVYLHVVARADQLAASW